MNSDDYFGGVMVMESDDDEEHSENPSCLIRYRSAPTSYFSDFIDDSARIDYGDLHPTSPTPEIDTILTRFIPYDSCSSSRFDQLQTSPISVSEQPNLHCRSSVILPPRPQHCAAAAAAAVAAATSDSQDPPSSILIRHSSSPAQFFSHDNSETGIGDPRREGIPDHLSFTTINPCSPSSSGICSVAVAGVDHVSARDDGSGGGNGKCYISGYPLTPWKCSEKMNSINGWEENRMNSGNGIQKSGTGYMRLPSSAVPCMTRAKRGCATHPRSIAERVRRTRISERMRKLEELVPNMEKQTSTADMLDLAVEYIKDLQQQVKILSEMGAKCTCRNGGNDAGVVMVVGTGAMAAPTTESSRKG